MRGPLSALIKEKDFEQTRYLVFLRNEKTGQTMSEIGDVKLLGVESDNLTVLIPKAFCGAGQVVTLFLFKEPMKDKKVKIPNQGPVKGSFEIVSKVESIEEFEENADMFMKEKHKSYVTFKFSQFDEFGWKKIVDEYKKAQQRITNVIKMASGE